MKRAWRIVPCLLFAGLVLAGCTSVKVKPVAADAGLRHLCILENPRVTVPGFVDILQEGIQRNGLTSELFSGSRPAHCEYVLGYTALRSWDLATYLSHAELWIDRDGRRVASAQYHLRGKGGLSLNKWSSTGSKMAPVIDELLAGAGHGAARAAQAARAHGPAPAVPAAAGTAVIAPSAPGEPMAVSAEVDGAALAYEGDAMEAARTFARIRNCTSGFRVFSEQEGRSIYSAGCWGNRKLLVACEAGTCREMR